jgi:four helix bundle protein
MQDFRQLKVWQKAHRFVLHVYEATQKFPAEERFGLTSQIRRAAVSIPANIAEGAVRSSDADFGRFLHIALGSASEVDYSRPRLLRRGALCGVGRGDPGD